MHVLALMKIEVLVHLYRQSRLKFIFHENIPVHENGCKNLQADVYIADENNFGVDAQNATMEVDVDISVEAEREAIAVGWIVVVAEKIDFDVNWVCVSWCWLFDSRIKDVDAMRLRKNKEKARSTTVPHFVTHV